MLEMRSHVFKGELLFSSVGPVKFFHGHQLCSSYKMHHMLAHYKFEGIFGFVCAGFSKKIPLGTFCILLPFSPKHPLLEAFFFF